MMRSWLSRLQNWPLATILLCFCAATIESFDHQALAVSAASLARALSLSKVELGWIFAATNAGLMLGATWGGSVADRFGCKRTFLVSVACFGALTLAVPYAGGFVSLLLLRFVSGLGFGAVMPVILVLAFERTKPSQRATITTAIYTGMPLGGITAAWYVASMGHNVDWRAPFLVGGCAALCLFIAGAIFLPMESAAIRPAGAPTASVSLKQALFADRRAARTILLWLIFLPIYFVSAVFISWLPILILDKGVRASCAPMMLVWNGIGGIFGSVVIGRLVDRFGFTLPLLVCHIALVSVLCGLAVASDPLQLAALSCASGVCVMGIVFPLYSTAASLYPESVRSTAVGSTIAIGRLGSVTGPLVVGVLLSTGFGPTRVLLLLTPLVMLSLPALMLLSRSAKQRLDGNQAPRPRSA